MSIKTYNLDYNGYWRDVNSGGLPSKSGVYSVYECTFNKQEGTVSLHSIIYIGEAGDIKDRVKNHEKKKDWLKDVSAGNTLCYNATLVDSYNRERVEAALIFKHKPPENEEYKDSFPFDTTTIKTSGKNALLKSNFTIQRI